MASKAFLAALAATDTTKDLDTSLSGSKYLEDGFEGEVTISAVDVADIDKDRVKFTYEAGGKEHNEALFLLDFDGESMSRNAREFLASVIPDKEAFADFLAMAGEDDHAWEVFTGMSVKLKLGRGKGYIVKSIGGQGYAAYDLKTDEKMTETFDEIKGVYEAADAAGLKRSRVKVFKFSKANAEGNLTAFANAVAARRKAKKK